jgi:hypothetical protein
MWVLDGDTDESDEMKREAVRAEDRMMALARVGLGANQLFLFF